MRLVREPDALRARGMAPLNAPVALSVPLAEKEICADPVRNIPNVADNVNDSAAFPVRAPAPLS
jgi:hypothetical protein